ncbi:uncharacterized protein FOMMEDRAFT_19860 [Fomitiporia mediterranea MF3/22]|uniref:uncharacterized protein n=1 Tax=Fomitiporia mediterranea (strain MF3/22) TaxID=694068 RepID=UPI0004408533|nr:uncharacterized protein FOMMEDRAFT_19860 [Fomitiporia mediterranea MF3/22]EJD04646.1 hypothetical protein FOMMEDRAFT_19860 [Fomitiporia mediterranea MF3/22]
MNAAYSSQEVIVLDCIPESAIISRVRWTDLRQKLPSWFYRPSGYLSAKELIPIPNDNGWQRYVRWQKAIQERLHQLSVVSWVRWELLSRREVVDFVFAVFSFQDYMGTNDLKPSLSGMDISRNFEELSKHAANSLLTWSRGFSSILLETEDDNEFTRLIQVSISTSPQDTMHSITKSFYIQSLG